MENHVRVHLEELPYDKDFGISNTVLAAIRAMADVDPNDDSHVHRVRKQYRHHLRTMLDHSPLSDPTPERNPLADPDLIQQYIQEAVDKHNSDALFELFEHGASPDTILQDGNTPLTKTMKILVNPDLLGVYCSFHEPEARRRAQDALRIISWILYFGANLGLKPNDITSKPAIEFFCDIVTLDSRDLEDSHTSAHSQDPNTDKFLTDDYYHQEMSMSDKEYFHHKQTQRDKWLKLLLGILLDKGWIYTRGRDVVLSIERNIHHPEPYPIPPRPERKPEVFEDWDGTRVRRNRYVEAGDNSEWVREGVPKRLVCQYDSEVVLKGGAWMVEEFIGRTDGRGGNEVATRGVSVDGLMRMNTIVGWWVRLNAAKVGRHFGEMMAGVRGRIDDMI